jgi:hypothetical protein
VYGSAGFPEGFLPGSRSIGWLWELQVNTQEVCVIGVENFWRTLYMLLMVAIILILSWSNLASLGYLQSFKTLYYGLLCFFFTCRLNWLVKKGGFLKRCSRLGIRVESEVSKKNCFSGKFASLVWDKCEVRGKFGTLHWERISVSWLGTTNKKNKDLTLQKISALV